MDRILETDPLKFFDALYPEVNGHYLEVRKLPSRHQTWCRSTADAVVASTDARENIYFGVCLRSGQSGNEEHAALLPALWADVDWKRFEGSRERPRRQSTNLSFHHLL